MLVHLISLLLMGQVRPTGVYHANILWICGLPDEITAQLCLYRLEPDIFILMRVSRHMRMRSAQIHGLLDEIGGWRKRWDAACFDRVERRRRSLWHHHSLVEHLGLLNSLVRHLLSKAVSNSLAVHTSCRCHHLASYLLLARLDFHRVKGLLVRLNELSLIKRPFRLVPRVNHLQLLLIGLRLRLRLRLVIHCGRRLWLIWHELLALLHSAGGDLGNLTYGTSVDDRKVGNVDLWSRQLFNNLDFFSRRSFLFEQSAFTCNLGNHWLNLRFISFICFRQIESGQWISRLDWFFCH